jgi:hypothetical protein
MTSPYAALQAQLATAGLAKSSPGYQIVVKAKFLPPTPNSNKLIGDADGAALKKLLKAYYDYGRQHWTWTQTSSGSAKDGGLVKGATSGVACGSFNANFRWLAENALGITGMSNGQEPAQFLTMPGGVPIDGKWKGNVCTGKQGFDQLRCFKFQGHYWVKHAGTNYDVCFNNTFGSAGEIIWTKLDTPDAALLKKSGLPAGSLYRLEKKLPAGDHLYMLSKNGSHGWPAWQIASADEVAKLGK